MEEKKVIHNPKYIRRHELIEVTIPANPTTNQFMIPDQPNLRYVLLADVKFYYDKIVPISLLTRNVVITKDMFQQAYLTLQNYGGLEFLKQAPVVQFQTIDNGSSGYVNTVPTPDVDNPPTIIEKNPRAFNLQKVNYPKSYITFPTIPTNDIDMAILFSVFYIDPSQQPDPEFKTMR